jgi:glutathione S-transferase
MSRRRDSHRSMYELYIANKNYSSWSLRPWILMRQLEIPFRERLVPFPPDGSDAGPVFRAFCPTGRVPCLHDRGQPDGGPTVVWDSLAITEYLAERHAGVWPAAPAARTWARCAAAEMHAGFTGLRDLCSMSCGVRIRLDGVPPALAGDLARISELWRDGLARFGGPFLAGAAFTAADAFFAPVAFRIQTFGLELEDEPAAYAARLLALPAMRAWYADALAETLRDPSHEAGMRGTLLEDLRAS